MSRAAFAVRIPRGFYGIDRRKIIRRSAQIHYGPVVRACGVIGDGRGCAGQRPSAIDRRRVLRGPPARARRARCAQPQHARRRARRHRHRDRLERADPDDRLPDTGSRNRRDQRRRRPHLAGDRACLRLQDRFWFAARVEGAADQADRIRRLQRTGRPRAGADRRLRRRRARLRGVEAAVRRQLGIPARRGDLHRAGDGQLAGRRADQQGRQADRRRFAGGRATRWAGASCRAICSCRSIS